MYNKKVTVQSIQVSPGGVGGWRAGGCGAHRVTHKIIKKYVTLIRHNSKSTHARAAKLHTNKILIVVLLNRGSTLMKDLTN